MSARPKQSAAGLLLAISMILGTGTGLYLGEITIGLIAGLVVGAMLALASACVGRR